MLFGKSKPLPVKKSESKKLNNKVSKALKDSKGKCVKCKNNPRKGEALFCKKCLKNIWSF
jgi:hypothetical protein